MEIGPDNSAASVRDDQERESGRRSLRCARCLHEITCDADRIEVDGRHEHYFVNPHGFDYNVLCFREAAGVVSAGAASSEFAWFSGMTWQLDCCRGCSGHLGWIFRSPRRVFHGLIKDRLVEASEKDD